MVRFFFILFLLFTMICFSYTKEGNEVTTSPEEYDISVVAYTKNKFKVNKTQSLSVLTQQDLDSLSTQTAGGSNSSYLKNILDLYVNDISNTGNVSLGISVDDMGPSYTGVALNGIKLEDESLLKPFGNSNLVPISSLNYIEIYRGGSSARYGSGASSGYVNFVTNSYETPRTDLNLYFTYGSLDSYSGGFNVSSYDGRTGLKIDVSFDTIQSYDISSDDDNLEYDQSTNSNIMFDYFINGSKSTKEYFISFATNVSDLDGWNGVDYYDDSSNVKQTSYLSYIRYKKNITNTVYFINTNSLQGNYRGYYDEEYGKTSYFHNKLLTSNVFQIDLDKDQMSFGIDASYSYVDFDYNDLSKIDISIFTNNTLFLTKKIKFDFGYRYNYYSIYEFEIFPLNDISFDGNPDAVYNVFDFALTYLINKNIQIYAKFANDYRTPSIDELFNPYYGNKDLKDEIVHNYHLGVDLAFRKDFSAQQEIFYNGVKNPVLWDTIENKYIEGKYLNSYGFSVKVNYTALKTFKMGFSYRFSVNDIEQEDITSSVADSSYNMQNLKGYVRKSFYHNKIVTTFNLGYVNRNEKNTIYAERDPYSYVDFVLEFLTDTDFVFYFKMLNTFDNQKETMYYQYNSPGRMLYVGIKKKVKK